LANYGHEFEPIELHISRQPKLLSSNQTPPPPAAFNWTLLHHAPPHLRAFPASIEPVQLHRRRKLQLIAAVGLFQLHNSTSRTSLIYKTRSSHHPLHSTTLPTAVLSSSTIHPMPRRAQRIHHPQSSPQSTVLSFPPQSFAQPWTTTRVCPNGRAPHDVSLGC
jgi:hypothetical protein